MAKKKVSPEAQAIMSAADAEYFATTVSLVEKFLSDNPESIRAWLDLGLAQGQLGRFAKAESAFQKVIELEKAAGESDSSAMFGEIGNLYREQGQFDVAISWYQKQIDAAPNDSLGYLYLGNIKMRKGQFAEAIEAFEKGRICDGVCLEEVHYSIGLAQRSLANYAEAKKHFELAINYHPSFAEAKVALKDVSALVGK